MKRQPWTHRCDGLEFETAQLKEEGRCVPVDFERAVADALAMPDSPARDAEAVRLFNLAQGFPYKSGDNPEPNGLKEIRLLSEGARAMPAEGIDLFDKAYGGWLARCAGCLLGKPVEGWKRAMIHDLCMEQDNYPVNRYLNSRMSDDFIAKYNYKTDPRTAFIDRVDGMPEDDDTNYTVIGLKLLHQAGRHFSSGDVADIWLNNLPYYHLCTAERVTYRNLVECIEPTQSAVFCNGYREWIGAQIRADIFGYINPGDPEAAAEMAWRDASISHVKNGIYGEMWVAAMIATAYISDDPAEIILNGLKTVPTGSRLTSAIKEIIGWFSDGLPWEKAVDRIHTRWNEADNHHWCHTISNAQIVAAALLYGGGDLEKTLGAAVLSGFDTDCNGATAGSVVGVMKGACALPSKWIAPLNDTLYSGVDNYNKTRISELAKETVNFIT